MKTAMIFACLATAFLLFAVYCLDLLLFSSRERKRFESGADKEFVADLEKKQKKTKHPQKKNYYLYLICLTWNRLGEEEKTKRLLPFLRNDPLLGVDKTKF